MGFFGAQRLRETYLQSIEQKLRDNSILISRMLSGTSIDQTLRLNEQVKDLGGTLACRITVIKRDGVVIADNEADVSRMDNHRLRPEVMAALGSGSGMSVR